MTTMAKPRILATRKLPDEVEARLMRDITVALNSEDRAMSSTEIAEKAKVSPVIVSRFLSGERDIHLGTADRLADVLGIKLAANA